MHARSFQQDFDFTFKIALTGNSAVGKSSLMMRFTDDYFSESLISTVGVDFKIRNLDINNKVVKLNIWDTAGQERFEAIVKAYYKGIHACFIVFDVTNRQSFQDVSKWHDKYKSNTKSEVRSFLIGNKCDMTNERQVSKQEAQELADEYGMSYIETSAKTSHNVDEAFTGLAKQLMASYVPPVEVKENKIVLTTGKKLLVEQSAKKASCC